MNLTKCPWCKLPGFVRNDQFDCICGYITEFCPVNNNWAIWTKNKKTGEETFLDGPHGEMSTRRAFERRGHPAFQ